MGFVTVGLLYGERTNPTHRNQEITMTKQETLKIPALHCSSCANTVVRVLGPLPSVKVTQTDLDAKLVHLRFDESAVSMDQIREALEEVGFFPED